MKFQAIVTRFIPPTDTRPSRIRATSGAGSITMSCDSGLDDHAKAAKMLADKFGWSGFWYEGGLPDGWGCVFVNAGNDKEQCASNVAFGTLAELFTVNITARQQGAIGKLDAETRSYKIEAGTEQFAREMAIERAHNDGLEHVAIKSAKKEQRK